MKRAWLVPLGLATLTSAWLLAAPTANSPAEPGEDLVTKEIKGFKFKVPADWPVEERGGTVAPIPTEEYLSKKFSAVTARFEAAEKRLTTLDTKQATLEQQVGALDKRLGTVDQRLTTVEHTQGGQGHALQVLQEQANATTAAAPAPAATPTGDLVPREETGR